MLRELVSENCANAIYHLPWNCQQKCRAWHILMDTQSGKERFTSFMSHNL